MATVNVSEADRSLSDLVERAEAGETVELVRGGRVVARLVSANGRPTVIDVDGLAAAAAALPFDGANSVEEMRRQDRY